MAAGLSRAKGNGGHLFRCAFGNEIFCATCRNCARITRYRATLDDADLDKLRPGRCGEVVRKELEGSLMLASHAMLLLGLPLSRVLKRIREVREHRYGFLSGFFPWRYRY